MYHMYKLMNTFTNRVFLIPHKNKSCFMFVTNFAVNHFNEPLPDTINQTQFSKSFGSEVEESGISGHIIL